MFSTRYLVQPIPSLVFGRKLFCSRLAEHAVGLTGIDDRKPGTSEAAQGQCACPRARSPKRQPKTTFPRVPRAPPRPAPSRPAPAALKRAPAGRARASERASKQASGCPSGAGAAPARSGCGGSACAVGADSEVTAASSRGLDCLQRPPALVRDGEGRPGGAVSQGTERTGRASRAALSRAAAQVLGVRGGRPAGCPLGGAPGAAAVRAVCGRRPGLSSQPSPGRARDVWTHFGVPSRLPGLHGPDAEVYGLGSLSHCFFFFFFFPPLCEEILAVLNIPVNLL